MNKGLIIFLSVILMTGYTCEAQPSGFGSSKMWKYNKHELLFGTGISNFLGDLGGLDRIGTHNAPWDLEWNTTRPTGHLGYRYRFKPMWATKTMLQYAMLKGDDALTNEAFRRNRNLSFRTHLIELSQNIEFIFYANEDGVGARHKIRGLKGMRPKNTLAYVFSGIAAFAYIPQGPGPEGGWTNLRPLNTEGQGLKNGGKEYGLIGIGIPVGIGYKFGIDAVWRATFELSYTQTFTDHIDDVSGVYYDNSAIEAAYGAEAAYFADPSSGVFPSWTNPGELRGDANHNDGYILLNITFTRNITGTAKYNRIRWKF